MATQQDQLIQAIRRWLAGLMRQRLRIAALRMMMLILKTASPKI
jgi:hypothetical protein